MISPYVRRRRLAAELKQLMQEHGYSAVRLATATRIPRQRISQIQNGHLGPSDADMMRILDVLKVGQRRAKPLTRDDAFSHIKWIESANADVTDPSTKRRMWNFSTSEPGKLASAPMTPPARASRTSATSTTTHSCRGRSSSW